MALKKIERRYFLKFGIAVALTTGINSPTHLVGAARAQSVTEVYSLYVVIKGFYEVFVDGPKRRKALENIGINQGTLADAQRETLAEIEKIPEQLSSSLRDSFVNEDQKTLEALTNTFERLSGTSSGDNNAINSATSLANRNASRLGQYDVPYVLPAFLYASALQLGFLSLKTATANQFKAALTFQKSVLEKYINPNTQFSADIFYPVRDDGADLTVGDHYSHAPPTDSKFDMLFPGDKVSHIEDKRIFGFGAEVVDALMMDEFGKDLQVKIVRDGSERDLRIQRDVPVFKHSAQIETILEAAILEPRRRLIQLRDTVRRLQGKKFAVSQYVPRKSNAGIEYGVVVNQFSTDGTIRTSRYSQPESQTEHKNENSGWTYEFVARDTVRETGCTTIPHEERGWERTDDPTLAQQRVSAAEHCIDEYLRNVLEQYRSTTQEISELYRLYFLGSLAHVRVSNALDQISQLVTSGLGDTPLDEVCEMQSADQAWLCKL